MARVGARAAQVAGDQAAQLGGPQSAVAKDEQQRVVALAAHRGSGTRSRFSYSSLLSVSGGPALWRCTFTPAATSWRPKTGSPPHEPLPSAASRRLARARARELPPQRAPPRTARRASRSPAAAPTRARPAAHLRNRPFRMTLTTLPNGNRRTGEPAPEAPSTAPRHRGSGAYSGVFAPGELDRNQARRGLSSGGSYAAGRCAASSLVDALVGRRRVQRSSSHPRSAARPDPRLQRHPRASSRGGRLVAASPEGLSVAFLAPSRGATRGTQPSRDRCIRVTQRVAQSLDRSSRVDDCSIRPRAATGPATHPDDRHGLERGPRMIEGGVTGRARPGSSPDMEKVSGHDGARREGSRAPWRECAANKALYARSPRQLGSAPSWISLSAVITSRESVSAMSAMLGAERPQRRGTCPGKGILGRVDHRVARPSLDCLA